MNGIIKSVCHAACAILFLPAVALAQDRTHTTKSGVRLTFPPSWAVAKERLANTVELETPAGPPLDVQARIYVTTTRYRSHAEAVKHLGEISAESPPGGGTTIRFVLSTERRTSA